MKRQSTFFLFLFAFLPTWATNYYVDSQQGSDHNNGKSILSPWKSMEKVNKQVFKPGDSLFFACNGVWFDHLKPQGSGNKKQPIVLSSYGSGNKPLLIGKGTVQDAVIVDEKYAAWLAKAVEEAEVVVMEQ